MPERGPCRALGCSCQRFSLGPRVGAYDHCSDCHHTYQIHTPIPPKEATP